MLFLYFLAVDWRISGRVKPNTTNSKSQGYSDTTQNLCISQLTKI